MSIPKTESQIPGMYILEDLTGTQNPTKTSGTIAALPVTNKTADVDPRAAKIMDRVIKADCLSNRFCSSYEKFATNYKGDIENILKIWETKSTSCLETLFSDCFAKPLLSLILLIVLPTLRAVCSLVGLIPYGFTYLMNKDLIKEIKQEIKESDSLRKYPNGVEPVLGSDNSAAAKASESPSASKLPGGDFTPVSSESSVSSESTADSGLVALLHPAQKEFGRGLGKLLTMEDVKRMNYLAARDEVRENQQSTFRLPSQAEMEELNNRALAEQAASAQAYKKAALNEIGSSIMAKLPTFDKVGGQLMEVPSESNSRKTFYETVAVCERLEAQEDRKRAQSLQTFETRFRYNQSSSNP